MPDMTSFCSVNCLESAIALPIISLTNQIKQNWPAIAPGFYRNR